MSARPTDWAALVAFRIGFGLLVAVSAFRFLTYGWIAPLFEQPHFRFTYWGFGWVPALTGGQVRGLFAALLVLGLMVAAGAFYRFAIAALFVAFTWIQLVDVSNYLNHYYLVSLLALLMAFMPLHTAFSVDAWRRPALRKHAFPAWCTALLRFQVATVYTCAGLAKLNADWLLDAQPLTIWLSAREGLPLIGPWLTERWVAFAFSWGGFLFDTTIAGFLLWRRTRPFAFMAVIGFHLATWVLFPIGMFPFIMVTSALVFFDPSWPRRFVRALPAWKPEGFALGRPALAVIGVYCAVQIALPLRANLYGGDVSWHEQGMRFAWRVMTREKNGAVTFLVKNAAGREWQVAPSRYLTRVQEREMSTQPDLILQLAQHIGRTWPEPVEVRAEALVSLNGHGAGLLVDPSVDLMAVRDGLMPKPWIRPR